MQVHTSLDNVGGSIVVAIDGIVDLAAVACLHDDLARAVRQHPAVTLLVDLDAVTVLDDAGLGVLLGAAAAARRAGGDLEVICTGAALCERLQQTGFDRAVRVRTSIAAEVGEELPDDPIFHLAVPDDWAAAFSTGEYRMSTRGVTLEQEGFIHCSTRMQTQDTANRFYGDLDQLIVLRIDPRLVSSPIRWEPPAPGVDTLFPHIYGPLPIAAVNLATPWRRTDDDAWSIDTI